MATTATLRGQYPELVLSQTGPKCDFTKSVPVVFYAAGPHYPAGFVILRVHPAARQAFRAQAAVMLAHRYPFREPAGGTLSCRKITGGTLTTLHAHGIAKDDNPSTNRYVVASGLIQWGRHTDRPMAMVRDIERIRTANGKPVFEWGGRWSNVKDPMHDELDALRADLNTGINLATVTGWHAYLTFETTQQIPGGPDPMLNFTIGPLGSPVVRGPEAATLQLMLQDRGHNVGASGPDGIAGDDTRRALRAWQAAVGIGNPELGEGRVGPYSYAALNRPDSMLPIGPWSHTETIRLLQQRMSEAYNIGLAESGAWDTATKAAIGKHLGPHTGDAAVKAGDRVNGRAYQGLTRDLIKTSGGAGGVSPTQLTTAIAAHAGSRLSDAIHPHHHDEGTTGPPR